LLRNACHRNGVVGTVDPDFYSSSLASLACKPLYLSKSCLSAHPSLELPECPLRTALRVEPSNQTARAEISRYGASGVSLVCAFYAMQSWRPTPTALLVFQSRFLPPHFG